MKPFEADCPLPSTHQRCAEAQYFLEQSLLHYHSPQPFLHNLNAFIQSLRNITFMLQSELNHRENFGAWYDAKRAQMRAIPPLKRMVEARNIVVKKNSLLARSKVSCGLFRGRRMKLSMNTEIEPFTDTRVLLTATARFVGDLFLGGKHEQVGEQAGVERTWIVAELGDQEVISHCLPALNYMLALVEEAHRFCGTESGLRAVSYDLPTFFILLESDVDGTLPAKWGWLDA
ncbi:MAG: hypothetical protein EOO54_01835 [Haliea sp.]|nr:MAG: hypothetical protein EOO54_01835 [Haliea sp.]